MEAPYLDEAETIRRMLERLFPRTKANLLGLRWRLMRLLGRPPAFELAVRALLQALRQAIRRFITETMMTIRFSEGVRLRLWKDLEGEYPADLLQLTRPELRSLLEQIDLTQDSLKSSGAADWASLPERLHFIADLFRLYQQNERLFEPPFTPEQAAAIKAERVPEGRL
jgi:hypothetical protein